jgi:uncharacterized membrane protein
VSASDFFEHVTVFFEVVGVLVLVLGLLIAVAVSFVCLRRGQGVGPTVTTFRNTFGGTLLLSLEILIAADLTRTVTVEPTLDNVLVLGVIVLIRTVLSISLDIEIDGVAPWKRMAMESGATKAARAVRDGLQPR